jgi:hypothetical protein
VNDPAPRATPALLRLRQYTEDALSLNRSGPPWHRGIVALASVLGALLVSRLFHPVEAVAVAPALALFMTLADAEAPLHLRLQMLLMAAIGMAVGGGLVLYLGINSLVLEVCLVVIVALAGIGSIIGPPYQQATRFAAVVGLLITVTVGIGLADFFGMVLSALALVAFCRTVEHLMAPDQRVGDFRSIKGAVFALRAARGYLPRFVISYVLAASAGWVMGRTVDESHPTWVTVSVIVVMWPDAQRSYQRILQRVVGTIVGAAVALLLISLARDARVLGSVAALMLYFLPHFIRRNYWLHTGLMMVFVMVSLDLWSSTTFTPHVLIERVGDVLVGCALALLGTFCAFTRIQERMLQAGTSANSTDEIAKEAKP